MRTFISSFNVLKDFLMLSHQMAFEVPQRFLSHNDNTVAGFLNFYSVILLLCLNFAFEFGARQFVEMLLNYSIHSRFENVGLVKIYFKSKTYRFIADVINSSSKNRHKYRSTGALVICVNNKRNVTNNVNWLMSDESDDDCSVRYCDLWIRDCECNLCEIVSLKCVT